MLRYSVALLDSTINIWFRSWAEYWRLTFPSRERRGHPHSLLPSFAQENTKENAAPHTGVILRRFLSARFVLWNSSAPTSPSESLYIVALCSYGERTRVAALESVQAGIQTLPIYSGYKTTWYQTPLVLRIRHSVCLKDSTAGNTVLLQKGMFAFEYQTMCNVECASSTTHVRYAHKYVHGIRTIHAIFLHHTGSLQKCWEQKRNLWESSCCKIRPKSKLPLDIIVR